MGRKKIALTMLLVFVMGCATDLSEQYMRDGVQYGVTHGVFRGRWWSYYERGSSFLAGDYLKEAEADLKHALTGRSDDSWRARTYGLHFVEYFPTRELGVTYFKMGRLEEAENMLRESLASIDTARAHHYLDQVLKAQIAQGVVEDTTAPMLAMKVAPAEPITPPAPAVVEPEPEDVVLPEPKEAPPIPEKAAPPKPAILTTPEVRFEIATSDDVGVEEVTVNGEALHQRGSAEEVSFEEDILLEEGTHQIEVAVTDLANKEVVTVQEVTVDLTGPTIGIFAPIEPTVTEHGTVILEGATVDKHGVVSVEVGERLVAESPGTPQLSFDTELPLGAGENTFVLAAKDVAGNETRTAVKVFQGDPESLEAKLWLLQQKHPERFLMAQAGGAIDLSMLLTAVPEDSGEIRLKSPKEDQPYRHSRTLRISGEVVTQSKVTSLSINGVAFDELTGAPKESFNRRIPIAGDADQMALLIEAKDDQGQIYKEEFNVDLRPVELNTLASRMPVAVLAFAGNGVDPTISDMLRLTTEAQIQKQNRFRIVDRTRLQDVLTEQELAAALADPNQAIALGKIINAHIFLVADVFKHDENGLEIKARVINTETSDLLSTLDIFIADSDKREAITAGCDALAAQLTARFPRLSGEVLGVREKSDGDELLVNWTREDGVQEGTYMIMVHEDEPWIDEDTGEILEPGELIEVGRARIVSISSSSTRAKTVEAAEEGVKLEKGMPAITM